MRGGWVERWDNLHEDPENRDQGVTECSRRGRQPEVEMGSAGWRKS